MKSDWKLVKIGDVGEVIGGGTPSTKNESYYGDEIAWITPKDLSGYSKKYISKGERSITKAGLENSSAKLLPKNTVLLSSRAPIGYVVIAANEMTTNQGFKSVVCNEDIVAFDYMYYVLKSSKDKLEAVASGSTFKEVSGKVVKDFEILIPDIITQNKITNILNSLDKKIECNMDIVSNLEELSQTFFKHWFIDFEFPNEEGQPYKSSGGKMVDSELGEIPDGSRVGALKDVSTIIMGQSPKSETYNLVGTGLPLINGASDFKGGDINPNKYTTDPKKVSEVGDYIFGVRATLGNVTETDKEYALGRGAGIARANEEKFKEYLYFQLIDAFNTFEHTASGSVYLNISKNDLNDFKVIVPSENAVVAFHLLTESMLRKKHLLIQENKKLAMLRNALLPRLLSGKIEIPDESVVD